MTIRNIILSALLSTTLCAGAQTLEKEITVSRDIEPAERAASRLTTVSPEIYRPEIRPHRLSALLPATPYAPYRGVATLEPAAWADTFAVSPYRGYLTAGYLPAFNLGVSAGYRFVSKPATQVGAWLQYNGESYKGRINPLAEKTTLKSNVFALGVDAAHSLKALRIDGKVSARFGNATVPTAIENDPTFARSFRQIDLGIGVTGKSSRLPWHAAVGFEHFGFGKDVPFEGLDLKAATQNILSIDGGVARAWQTARVGADLSFDLQTNNQEIMGTDHKNQGLFKANPYLAFIKDRFNARIGVNLAVGDGLYVAPDVRVAYAPSQQVAVQVDLTGGKTLTNLSTLHDADLRMTGIQALDMTRVPFDGMARLVIGPTRGLVIEIHGGWARANNFAIYGALNSLSRWDTADVSAFTGGLKASWTYNDKVSVRAGLDAAQHSSPERLYYKWRDGAGVVATAGFDVKPIDRLTAGLDWELRTGRRGYNFDTEKFDMFTIHLGQVNNLRLHADYAISERFNVGLNLENLLCRRWYTAPGAQSASLHGLISAAYKF